MDHRFDVMENLDDSLLENLCLHNEVLMQEATALDKLCQANESSSQDMTSLELSLEKLRLNSSDKTTDSLLDTASTETVKQVYREMSNEDAGWHNQEYAMAEAEQRLRLLLDKVDP